MRLGTALFAALLAFPLALDAAAQEPTASLNTLRQPRGSVAVMLRGTEGLMPRGTLTEKVAAMAEKRQATTGGTRPEAHIVLILRQPLDPELRQELLDNGVEIIDRADPGVWVARVDPDAAARLAKLEVVAEADVIPLAAKLSPLINPEAPFDWQRRDGDRIAVSVLFHQGVGAGEAARLAETDMGAKVEQLSPETFGTLRTAIIAIPPDKVAELASYDIVQWVEPAPPPNADQNLLNTQPLSNVDDVQIAPYNLSGTGVTVGIWEAGDTIRATHQDLTPRVTVQPGQTASQDGHALHVAGTVGSSGVNTPNAEGMAPAVTILSWDDTNDTAEMTTASAGATPQVVASNHSYGAVLGWTGNAFAAGTQAIFGSYTNRSVNFDTVVNSNDLVVVKSAGNDRNDGGPTGNGGPGQPRDCTQGGLGVDADCIGPVGVAKNVITVGAMNGNGVIANFSSFGPTDDGRIKPDLVAQGVGVLSLGDFGVPVGGGPATDDIPQTNTGTWTASGTSMSTPAVTGIVALMFQEFANQSLTPSAAAMKAILIQTARDVNGPGQSTLGPDFATGWGIADAQAAADLLRRPGGPGYAEGTLTATGAAGAWDFPFIVPAGQPEMHVTLAWSDPPGTPAGAGSELVNDLDIRLIPPGGGAGLTPWRLNAANPGLAAVRNGGDDAINNVEQVSVLNPAAGTWTARVTAKAGSLALGSQRFAIAGPITPDTGPIAGPKANIMMALDKSGSMILPAATSGLNKMQALQNAATAFVDYIELVGGHNVGIVAFDTNVATTTPVFGLQALNGGSAGNARTAIGNLAPGGRTAIIAGVTDATGQLAGPTATNAADIVFLFSDGRHNEPSGSNVATIDGIMANDTRFFSIGFGTDVDSTVMPGVATNHDGIHLEEQGLAAGQLAKLFMVVGGLAADETIVIDPDYTIAPGGSAAQSIYATGADRTLTFAAFLEQPAGRTFQATLYGPNRRCKIPLKAHDGLDLRQGQRHVIVRVTLPYVCKGGIADGAALHEGIWQLRTRNLGDGVRDVKIMVLADSAIDFALDVQPRGRKALLSARLTNGDRVLRKGVRMYAYVTANRPSTGDSEKEDLVTTDRPDIGGGVIDIPGSVTVQPGTVVTGTVVTVQPDRPTIAVPGRATLAPSRPVLLDSPAIARRIQPVDPTRAYSVTAFLEDRALRLRLSPEIIAQLQGRFAVPAKGSKVELRDDGTNGDRRAGDGVFSVMIGVPQAGLFQVRAVANQALTGGMLTREALASFHTN